MNTTLARKSRTSLLKNRRGASLVEYALMCFLILVAVASVWKAVGSKVGQAGQETQNAFNNGG